MLVPTILVICGCCVLSLGGLFGKGPDNKGIALSFHEQSTFDLIIIAITSFKI